MLDLNDTQQSVLALAFKYADDKQLPLVNLEDLRALLNHLNSDAGKAEMAEYGGIATATAGVIIRKTVELEQQEADAFFGAPEFDVDDFLRLTDDGKGIVSILELADMQDRPALFSTFMMWLLASLYESLPEIGDPEKPKLVFFFDEAHLLFRDASKAFMQEIELVARLIRSKGVGVFFVTHSPSDVPAEVLGQLGNRVQHALRAFTPDDLEVVRATAETFPTTELYDVEEELTALGTGEALDHRARPQGAADANGTHDDAAADVVDGPGRPGGRRLRGGRVGDRADLRHGQRPRVGEGDPRRSDGARHRGREGADGGRRGSGVARRAQDAPDAGSRTRRGLERRGEGGGSVRAVRDVQHDPAQHPRGPDQGSLGANPSASGRG